MLPKLQLRGLSKFFDGKAVIDDLSLSVESGEVLVIMGRSGSGKTVLLKTLIGILKPDAGSLSIDGKDWQELLAFGEDELANRFGMLFQKSALFDGLPIWENVSFRRVSRKQVSRAEARQHAIERLAQVGLQERVADLFPADLSGGMQKRAALARAISSDPEIVLLDEPTAGLDPIMTNVIADLILDNARRLGATVVSVTSDLAVAEKIGDRLILLDEGRIVWSGRPEEIRHTEHANARLFVKKWAA